MISAMKKPPFAKLSVSLSVQRKITVANMYNRPYNSAKPFVKWAGGKTQLIEEIEHTLPSDLLRRKDVIYVEPFVGGGAV